MFSSLVPYSKTRAPGPLAPTPISHTFLGPSYVTSSMRLKSSFTPSLLVPTSHESVMGSVPDPRLRLYFDRSYLTSRTPF